MAVVEIGKIYRRKQSALEGFPSENYPYLRTLRFTRFSDETWGVKYCYLRSDRRNVSHRSLSNFLRVYELRDK